MTRSAAIRQSAARAARSRGCTASSRTDVAIGHQVSPMVGLIAASLPPRARVLAAEGDFTSLLFPLLAAGCDVRTIPLGAARRRGRPPHRPGGRLSRPIRGRTARRFGRHLKRSSQLRRADVGRRHPGVRLATARRRAFLSRGDGWVQMAMPPARDRVHDDRARTARPDRPASRRLVRRRASRDTCYGTPCDSPATPAASTSRPLG